MAGRNARVRGSGISGWGSWLRVSPWGATIAPRAGRAGMRPFVVEAGTPGCQVTKLEHKLGIRASDTASVVLQECRVPFENILGSPEVAAPTEGLKGAGGTLG